MRRTSPRMLLPGALLLLMIVAQPAAGFVTVAYDTDVAGAPRWSATEIGARGIADGAIQVFVEPNFAETIAMAVTGMVLPEDVAAVESTVLAACHGWESPVLHFAVTFDGAATRDPTSGGEIDLFAIQSSDPGFPADAFFGVTHSVASFAANRQLTNGTVLAGLVIYGADILIAVDRLAAIAPALSREQQVRALQRLVMHEIGHAIGFGHAQDYPELNFDTDNNPNNAMLTDPSNPLAALILSPNVDGQSIMNRFPTDLNGLFYTSLHDDERGGRDALYPALGAIPDICQPMPVAGCRTPLKSVLQIDNAADDGKDKLLWEWLKGAATGAAEFGDPSADTRYSLCLYKGALPLLAAELALPPGADRWKTVASGFRYKEADGLPHGVRSTLLKGGVDGKAKIIVKGVGPSLLDTVLPLGSTPVVAQFFRADTATCWQSSYDAAAIAQDDALRFKAKAQ